MIGMKVKRTSFDGIFRIGDEFATKNLVPGEQVYGERLLKLKGIEYRLWDRWRSKPCAALHKGLRKFPLKRGMRILYLGIASGTTSSHFSDIIGGKGLIYGVEISERPLRDLLLHAEKRGNIVPILADARKPEEYEHLVAERVDLIYEDIADPDQIGIMLRNAGRFLRRSGWAMMAIKSQSIDVTLPPRKVYQRCVGELEQEFEIVDRVELDPYQRMHLFLVMRLR
jgi:fibrillarin-like pre-rRNA processing protein